MGQIEKRTEFFLHTVDELKKIVLGFLPGGHVADGFLNFWSNLKQKRIIEFAESLKSAMIEISDNEIDVDESYFTTEEFVDLFDSVISKVQNTKSENKQKYFRNILLKQIINPINDEIALKYVQLLDEINDVQIAILTLMQEDSKYDRSTDFIQRMLAGPGEGVEFKCGDSTVYSTKDNVEFYTNELFTKGLLINKPEKKEVMPSQFSSELSIPSSFQRIEDLNQRSAYIVSKIAINFMNFIKDFDDSTNALN